MFDQLHESESGCEGFDSEGWALGEGIDARQGEGRLCETARDAQADFVEIGMERGEIVAAGGEMIGRFAPELELGKSGIDEMRAGRDGKNIIGDEGMAVGVEGGGGSGFPSAFFTDECDAGGTQFHGAGVQDEISALVQKQA